MNNQVTFIGYIVSSINDLDNAPKMETAPGAVRAVIELNPEYQEGLDKMKIGAELDILTWLHQADRTVLKVHPHADANREQRGVFSTRSPARPNPIGVHRVKLISIDGTKLTVEPIEAINGTPVIDIKSRPRPCN